MRQEETRLAMRQQKKDTIGRLECNFESSRNRTYPCAWLGGLFQTHNALVSIPPSFWASLLMTHGNPVALLPSKRRVRNPARMTNVRETAAGRFKIMLKYPEFKTKARVNLSFGRLPCSKYCAPFGTRNHLDGNRLLHLLAPASVIRPLQCGPRGPQNLDPSRALKTNHPQSNRDPKSGRMLEPGSCLNSLPEFLDFVLFEKTILVAKIDFATPSHPVSFLAF